MNKIKKSSLTDAVYQSLLDSICEGTIPAGAELTTVHVAEQLGVSRTPVQHALRRLAAVGLIEEETGRKAHVKSFQQEDIREIFEIRRLLETAAAEQVAQSISEERLAELDSIPEDSAEGILGLIVSSCPNRRLAAELLRYRLLTECFIRPAVEHGDLHARQHLSLLRVSLQARNRDSAAAAITAYLGQQLATILEARASE